MQARLGQKENLLTYWDSEGGLSSSHKTPAKENCRGGVWE